MSHKTMLECPRCGYIVDGEQMMGPKKCPALLSNARRKELGLDVCVTPPHLAELGAGESLGGICNKKLVPLGSDEFAGARAVVQLQGFANITEDLPKALKGWRGMSAAEKKTTLEAYAAVFGGRP